MNRKDKITNDPVLLYRPVRSLRLCGGLFDMKLYLPHRSVPFTRDILTPSYFIFKRLVFRFTRLWWKGNWKDRKEFKEGWKEIKGFFSWHYMSKCPPHLLHTSSSTQQYLSVVYGVGRVSFMTSIFTRKSQQKQNIVYLVRKHRGDLTRIFTLRRLLPRVDAV